MEKNGYVIFSDDKIARIRIKRDSSCGGNCSHCKGCGTDEVLIEIDNKHGLKSGENVKITMEDSSFVKNSFIGYGVLVILVLFGAIFGYVIFDNEFVSLLFLIGFMFIGFGLLRLIFKKKEPDIKVKRCN